MTSIRNQMLKRQLEDDGWDPRDPDVVARRRRLLIVCAVCFTVMVGLPFLNARQTASDRAPAPAEENDRLCNAEDEIVVTVEQDAAGYDAGQTLCVHIDALVPTVFVAADPLAVT